MSIDFERSFIEAEQDVMAGFDSSYYSLDYGYEMSDDEVDYWFDNLEKRGFV